MADRGPRPGQPRRPADAALSTFDTDAAEREQSPGGIAHESGELHRLLIESVQDYAIFALDPNGYVLSWNAGAERFKGYKSEEIVGKHFSIFYPPERIAEGFPQYELKEAARTGRFEDEGWRLRKDGSLFWANVVITALRDDAGTLLGFAKVTRDLTQRRSVEEALRLSEERFRLLVQSVADYAIFMLDCDGRVATWNEGAERIKGYTAGEIIGKHFSIFYPPERVAEKFPQYELKEAARTGRFEDEGWRVRRDGSRFWANVVITALRDSRGTLIGFGKVTRDLTERRRAEVRALNDARRVAAEEAARRVAEDARHDTETLRELTSQLASAHTVPDIARVVTDHGFRLLGVAAGALAIAVASSDEIRLAASGGYAELPAWSRRFRRADPFPLAESIRTGSEIVIQSRAERDARFPRLADLLAPYESTVVLPLTARGAVVGSLALHFASSVSVADRSLRLMRAFAAQCAQAVERAQLYEAEQQARHDAEAARRRADEANRAKSEFLAAMSHDLRTPLNAIGGYAELLEIGVSGPVTEGQHEYLRRIRRSQQHLLGIINDLLNFSRLDAGRVALHPTEFAVTEVMETVGQMIALQATHRGITFDVTPCPPSVVVHADRAKTEQVLLNLLSNAVKFTERGGSVSVSCEPGGDRVAVIVRDTGHGIPADQLERIFEPFVQVGRSLTEPQDGTGLGLAISRELARAMGGEISVESTVGQGSAFTLVLPTPGSPAGSQPPA